MRRAVGDNPLFPPPPRNLQEEGPTMRSVAILGAPGGAGPIGLQRNTDLYGSKPSSALPGRPSAHFVQLKKSPLTSESKTVRLGTKAYVSSKWSVKSLEPLPDGFPLERTSRRIFNSTGDVVATRINDCLVNRSIEAVYDDDAAKAKCRTSDYVSFRVRLFSDGQDGVVVEVQRRRGSAFNFMKDCRAILDAAEGRGVQMRTPSLKPISDMACLKGVSIDEYRSIESANSTVIKAAEELLQKDESDTNLLGMQNLLELTNPRSTSLETVRLVAQSVFSEDNSIIIRNGISSLLRYSSLQGESANVAVDEKEVEYDEMMHNLALSVVHNALAALSNDDSLSQSFELNEGWFLNTLVPVLIRDLESAETRPHDACTAARCIQCLAVCAPFVRKSLTSAGALRALCDAQAFGAGNHISLSRVADLAVKALKCQ